MGDGDPSTLITPAAHRPFGRARGSSPVAPVPGLPDGAEQLARSETGGRQLMPCFPGGLPPPSARPKGAQAAPAGRVGDRSAGAGEVRGVRGVAAEMDAAPGGALREGGLRAE